MNRRFGTDGVRGRVGRPPLDPVSLTGLAEVVARRLTAGRSGRGDWLIARDTRASGPWVTHFFARALAGSGIRLVDGGVLPTPAVSRLLSQGGWLGGVVVSASHNPAPDNGLKFFGPDGDKIPDAEEAAIEAEWAASPAPAAAGGDPGWPTLGSGALTAHPELLRRYTDALWQVATPAGPGPDARVVVDAAHGAGVSAARQLTERLTGQWRVVADAPDGHNINLQCGATAPGFLSSQVIAAGADWGLALDGDGDRVMAVDGRGTVLDGDALLYLFARYLDDRGELTGRRVVGTVMTNMGLEAALARHGIGLIRTPVGDRHVHARMTADGLVLGGEPSGHLILGRLARTGDGLLAGLFLWRVLAESGVGLADLLAGYTPYPCQIFNLRAERKPALAQLPAVAALEAAAQAATDGQARLVIRYSGTEPLLRVMIEAPHLEPVLTAVAPALADLRRTLGG